MMQKNLAFFLEKLLMFCKQLQVVLKFSAFVVVVPLKKTVYVTLLLC